MSSHRFVKAGELFDSALALPPEKRSAYLKDVCGEDATLLAEVESLLAAHDQAKGFMQTPAFKNVDLTPAEDQLTEGQQIGAYRILRQIGRGGMGAVYLAERADKQFKKHVAIKLVKRGMDTDYILRHFRNERQILANFDHANIARLLDGGSTETGLPYFVMEYVEGKPIDQYCDENHLNITKRLKLFQQVCAAVAYAHRNLVIHRDIKPSNILVTSDGVPKLLDFGIAKIMQTDEAGATATGIHLMTPEFASPEQAQGQPVTTLSDVYSLGVVLYELLTGHSPYPVKSRTPIEIARIITETQPVLPSTIVNPEQTCEGTVDRLRKRLRGDLDNIVLMALRKEAERRYQSVEQLSADIGHHLEGLPIQARKDTFGYRASKFVQRNKVAVGVVLFAFVAIAVFAAIAGFIQWKANQQAKLFQEFGLEVSSIEAIMRYSYLLPLHDTQKDKQKVTERLVFIKKRMQVLGSISYGPGYYSLGRGYLALHRYQDAYDSLIQAWEKYNYRDPAVANSLGLSLAMLYQEKLHEAEQLYGKDQLKQRKEQLEKQYSESAQKYIKQGTSASESPEYVSAILAYLRKEYSDALKKADSAYQNISWHYEAKKLQGDIFAALGKEQHLIGKINPAIDFYAKAKNAYIESAKKGQSDPQIYEGLCLLHSNLQELYLDQKGTSLPAHIEEGVSYCEKALLADSRNVNANLYASKIFTDLAYSLYLHGDNCSAETDKAADFANAVLKIDPENGLAFKALGNAYKIQSATELERGGNPDRLLEIATLNLEKASKKLPGDAELLSNLGAAYINWALYKQNTGQDPNNSINRAILVLKRAVELTPDSSKFHGNLGIAYCRKAIIEDSLGIDARNSFKQSIQESKKSISINPQYVSSYIWAGLASNQLASVQMDRKENPIPAITDAIAFRKKALELDPNNAYSYNGLGFSFTLKANYLQENHKDPQTELEAARECYKKSISINDKIVANYEALGEVELSFAQHALSMKKSPEPHFKNAAEYLNEGLKKDPESYLCFKVLASLHLMKADYFRSIGKAPLTEVQLGIEAADRTLDSNPKFAEVHGTRGKLFLISAQLQSGSARLKAANEALACFDRAFELNGTLRKNLEKDWDEAKRLSQN